MTATAKRGYAPEIIVAAGCLIALISFGPRASAGLFQLPMVTQFGWGRDTFSLALAIQNLLWGLGAPFAGAIADRFGMVRVLCAGALLYAAGLVTMSYASTPLQLHLGAGVLIGFGLSACSFNLILAAFGKLLPGAVAPARLRRRHGRRLLRPVPVPADRQHPDRDARLAAGVDRLRLHLAAGAAALGDAGDAGLKAACRNARRRRGAHPRASRRRWPRPSSIAPMSCSCWASSPAASSSPSSPCTCRPI